MSGESQELPTRRVARPIACRSCWFSPISIIGMLIWLLIASNRSMNHDIGGALWKVAHKMPVKVDLSMFFLRSCMQPRLLARPYDRVRLPFSPTRGRLALSLAKSQSVQVGVIGIRMIVVIVTFGLSFPRSSA